MKSETAWNNLDTKRFFYEKFFKWCVVKGWLEFRIRKVCLKGRS